MRTVFQFSILHRMNLVTMGSLIQELQDIQIFQICHYIFSEHLVLRIFPTFERCCHQLMDSSYIQILQIHKFDSDETIQDPSEHCILCILKLYWIKLNLLLFWGLWLRCNSRKYIEQWNLSCLYWLKQMQDRKIEFMQIYSMFTKCLRKELITKITFFMLKD